MYATLADFVKRFKEFETAELSDLDSHELSEDRSRILSALADADSEIDGILGRRYVTPLTTPNRLIIAASCHIARKILYRDDVEKIMQDYQNYIDRLMAIADGEGHLEGAIELSQAATSGVYPTTYQATRKSSNLPKFG